VDTNGLILTVKVHVADLLDRDGGRWLLAEDLQRELPRLKLVWADGAYTSGFRNGRATSEGGRWRCRITATGSCDATGSGGEAPRLSDPTPEVGRGAHLRLAEPGRHLSKDYERLPRREKP
jgi:hypothetical protein